jgi:predicted dehydrogenase
MKLALIGCGVRGQAFAAAAAELSLDVSLCIDSSIAAARRVAAGLNARPSRRPLDAISAADAVIFPDPLPAAAATALRALRAGKAVFWAAPIAANPKDARSLLDAAKASGVPLVPDYTARVCPQFAAASAQVAADAAGPIGFVRVHRRARSPRPPKNGVALTALAHDLEWILSLFGPVAAVYAQIVRKQSVDCAMLTLTLAKGPLVQCVASSTAESDSPGHAAIELCGARGMIQFNTHSTILSIAPHSESAGRPPHRTSPLAPSLNARRLTRFVETVQAGRLSEAALKHEMRVVRVVEAALESARAGRAVKM